MRKKAVISLVALVLVLVVLYLGVGYMLYNQLSDISSGCQNRQNRPDNFADRGGSWREDFDYSAYFMPGYETMTFPSREENIEIAAWYVEAGANAPAVILVHGLGSCKYSHTVLTPAGMLHNAGFNVLMIDVRDAGDSTFEDGRSAVGNEEYQDALGAWDWLVAEKGIPPERIGLLGESLGAATSLIAFSQEPRLAAVFVDSPFDNLPQIIREELARNSYPTLLMPGGIVMARLVAGDDVLAHDPNEAIAQANGRPLFVVHGTGDTRISVRHSYQLQEQAEALGADATFWFPEDVEHVRTAEAHTAEYEERLVTFFREALGQ